MHEILLIGPVGCGKTTLKQRMLNEDISHIKTQVVDFAGKFIDCPGEYLEIPRYYHVIIDLSHRSSEVWALQDACSKKANYPPNFVKSFNKPVIGIITKTDKENSDTERAEGFLRSAGIIGDIYSTSAVTGTGCDDLFKRVLKIWPEMKGSQ